MKKVINIRRLNPKGCIKLANILKPVNVFLHFFAFCIFWVVNSKSLLASYLILIYALSAGIIETPPLSQTTCHDLCSLNLPLIIRLLNGI